MKNEQVHMPKPLSTQYAVLISCLFLIFFSCNNSKPVTKDKDPETVTTIGYFDTLEAKSGYNINGYWVSLTEEQVKKYKGKKVEVKGLLIIVEAVDENAEIKTQGASTDQKFISEPVIRIIE
jgi:hypothetical protein